ncbi:2-octaprenyl-6-methoxyphenyl hydroxylase [Simiduia sp. 21SJ11W-1]|uniref:2-octaprenyl-6-methoxyphenyl hydroxylase n=1 Tax=Simiduia sp. 21SJ11W-1 TaxID=2909669 RepID=UPI0020A1238A|nr:2-octaprenyl-6-methoxyphenyl hydroxylase [Simiduia sp. 21SJ11W-1]UTA48438.1 2-octaprenyl-6-methoxyphenyl hydroxylase [Simiduia sp. 21SJ11W-1]
MTEPEFETDVTLIGAGMVGATAALLLAKRIPGLRIRLLERFDIFSQRAPQPSFDQRATAVAAGSWALLQALDLEPELGPLSGEITEVQVSDRGHWGHAHIRAAEHQLARLGRVVPNQALGQALMQRLGQTPAIEVRAPETVQRLRPIAGGYQVTAESCQFNTRLLILADGANDALKKQLGLSARQTDYQQLAAIANVQVEKPHLGRAFERFTCDGPMALLPLADPHQLAMVWTLPKAQAQVAELSDAEFCRRAQAHFGDRLGNFLAVGKRDVYPLVLHEATEQVRSHLVLLGNAAHFLHPVAGQGFNLSVRDLATLVDTLAQDVSRQGVANLGNLQSLQAYASARAQDQLLTVQYSHQLVAWFSSDHWLRFLPRQLGLMALQSVPSLKHLLAEQSMGRGVFARGVNSYE